jgi:hypothetical protein
VVADTVPVIVGVTGFAVPSLAFPVIVVQNTSPLLIPVVDVQLRQDCALVFGMENAMQIIIVMFFSCLSIGLI